MNLWKVKRWFIELELSKGAKFGGFMAVLRFGRLQELKTPADVARRTRCLEDSMTWRRCAVVFLCFYAKEVVN